MLSRHGEENLTSRKNHPVHLWPTSFIRANYVQPPPPRKFFPYANGCMIRKRTYCTSNYWWISISNVHAIYVFLQTRWSVKTSIFLCHEIKRWYLQERSIMDTSLNTWYFINLGSNRFRFLVESGRSARDARKQEKNLRASCALGLF